MNANSEWIDLALECFAELAARAGVDARAYQASRHWIKSLANRFHIVLKMEADARPSLIYKQVFRPEDPTEFNGILDAHHRAWTCLQEHPHATVPQILAEDREMKACLMRFQPGQTLRTLCQSHRDHRPFLRAAGMWLSAFHANTFVENRQFQPKFMARHMLHLADQVQRGEHRVERKGRFIKLVAAVQDFASTCEGRPSKVAGKHGDMNDHNVLISDHQVAGYDFLPASDAPVGYDIARLLLSYMISSGDLTRIPKGHVLPPDALEAFFKGYTFVGPDDPGVTFLLRTQILSDWNRMADKPKDARTIVAFERLCFIAKQAFG